MVIAVLGSLGQTQGERAELELSIHQRSLTVSSTAAATTLLKFIKIVGSKIRETEESSIGLLLANKET